MGAMVFVYCSASPGNSIQLPRHKQVPRHRGDHFNIYSENLTVLHPTQPWEHHGIGTDSRHRGIEADDWEYSHGSRPHLRDHQLEKEERHAMTSAARHPHPPPLAEPRLEYRLAQAEREQTMSP